jgi:hypothetical protein
LKAPGEKLESLLRESTRNLVQYLTAIHGYLQLLQAEEMSTHAKELVQKLVEQDQRACALLQTLIGLEQSQKNIMAAATSSPDVDRKPARGPVPVDTIRRRGRILLVGSEGASIEFQRSVLFYLGGEVSLETQVENVRQRLLNEEFELVFMDENCLPAGQVEELHHWIAEKCPAMQDRIVFLTSEASRGASEKLGFRTLQKPLQLPELIQCSRELLSFPGLAERGTVQ